MSKPTDIQTIIENSGNHFHSKVVAAFQAGDWSVLISPYYNDNITDKPREIDLVTEKAFPIRGLFGDGRHDIDVRLFIECKYVPQPMVLWFHDKDMEKAKDLVLRTTPMTDNNIYTDHHHYLSASPQVAKLFAGGPKQSGDNDPLYKALNQSLNAMVYFRRAKSIIPEGKRGFRESLRTLIYPVILCNSFEHFYQLTIGSDEHAKKIEGNFQLEVNYAYVDQGQKHRQEYFLIDVVEFKRLDEFFETLKKDVQAMRVFVGHG
jgi:hypothetical protein